MAQTSNAYANCAAQALTGHVNFTADTIKMALLGAGYTPNLTAHIHFADVSASEITGTGYTAGGQALTTPTVTVTSGSSWGTSWAATTAYALGALIRPSTANGYLYQATNAGTSGSAAPTWPTAQGLTVIDGSVTWVCVGESVTVLSSAAVTWASSTITANYAVIYDAQTGVGTTEPLICLINFGSAQSSAAGPFTVTPANLGWISLTPA